MNPYYEKQIEEARKYQDFVKHELYGRGIPLVFNDSKHYQYAEGENILGAEIKNDKMFRDTGNLYIEIAEKTEASNKDYVKSGIYRDDNSWLYTIGDYKTIYIFGVKHLIIVHSKGKYREVTKDTSIGFLYPVEDAASIALRVINIQ